MLNVLVIGSGGREHALAWKLKQSPKVKRLFALPGSAGISAEAECLAGDPLNPAAVVDACRRLSIDLVVVGPEAPLSAGLADELMRSGIKVFGPRQAAARLEASKAYAKDFMKRHGIPTAQYETFSDPAKALAKLDDLHAPVVVKADGLAAGKGVRVCRTIDEARSAVNDFMVKQSLGASGATIVLEECLEGPEATIMAFCDGKILKALAPSRDHKRLEDNDKGPNTGGMGAFSPIDLPPEVAHRIKDEILDRTLQGLKSDDIPYCGIIYFGIMITPSGPKLLEYNCRFGDPETQVVLPQIQSDLVEILQACISGELDKASISLRPTYCVTVVLASEGYPQSPQTGRPITGIEMAQAANPDALIFHAGTAKGPGGWMTAGGRVMNVVGCGATLDRARDSAYLAVERIRFDGMHYRKDIAASLVPSPSPRTQPKSQAQTAARKT